MVEWKRSTMGDFNGCSSCSPPFCVNIKHANNQQQGVLFYMNITSKYRSLSVQAKAALWFTICSFLQKGISFITVPIFTRLMSTEE